MTRSISATFMRYDSPIASSVQLALGRTARSRSLRPPYYALKVYLPSESYSGPNNQVTVSLYKAGIQRFSKTVYVPLSRLERILGSTFTEAELPLTVEEALWFSYAADPFKHDDVEVWLFSLPADASSTSTDEAVVGSPGNVFKVDVIRGDQDIIGLPDASERVGARLAVTDSSELPSRNGYLAPASNDAAKKEIGSRPLVPNELSAYETGIAASYYRVDDNTVRVALLNLPPGFDRLQVQVRKTGQRLYSTDSVRRIDDQVTTDLSSFFFAGVQGKSEPGNGFTKAGGHVVFDLQMRVDLRNNISLRINDAPQNFFLNLRDVNGDLIQDNPRSGLPMFKIPLAHAGEYAHIRLHMLGGIGVERYVNVGEVIGTMSYSEPKARITSQPFRLRAIPTDAAIMSTIPITPDNEALFRVRMDLNGVQDTDVAVDLGTAFQEVTIPESIVQILGTFRGQNPILAGRQGGVYIVANVRRFDSMTGQTVGLGVFSTDRFIDQVSNPDFVNSVAAFVGAKSRAEFLDRANDHGLTLVYTAEFYEISGEMIAAFLSMDSADDERSAELFYNLTNARSEETRRLLDFINEIVYSRTSLKQAALEIKYHARHKPQPNMDILTAVSVQRETNAPFQFVECAFSSGAQHVAYVEVQRVLDDTAFRRVRKFGQTRESLGFLPVIDGSFAFRDFIPGDMVNVRKNGTEKPVRVYYELFPYEYVIDNGLVTNTIRRREDPVVARPTT